LRRVPDRKSHSIQVKSGFRIQSIQLWTRLFAFKTGRRFTDYIRKAIQLCSKSMNPPCIQYAPSQPPFWSSHMTMIQSAIQLNLQYISAKQSKSMHPLRIQYSTQIAFNTFSVARFRTQVNPCKSDYNPTRLFAFKTIPHSEYTFNTGQCKSECIQYRNPSQINTVFCIHFRFQYNMQSNTIQSTTIES